MNNEEKMKSSLKKKGDKIIPFIFLAEDDIDDEELLIEALQDNGKKLEIQSVNNGKKAVNILDSLPDHHLPCLIVLDFNLPEIDGSQILEFLSTRERFLHIPKVVWSTSNSQPYRDACLKLGAKAYFTKPNDISGIKTLAKEMLEFCSIS
jgi:CheY-like chemotaxis protein